MASTTFFIIFLVSVFVVGGVSQTPAFSSPVVEKWYTQPFDHFVVGSNTTFQQRVFVDTSYRHGKPVEDGTPILAFFGGEASIEAWLGGGGIVTLVASRFQAIVVYIEALADFANVLVSLKTEMLILHSPVIVFGGFYSGMLAAYFRMKYLYIADGALASSAPILGTADTWEQYCAIVSRDFASENLVCYGYISESWRQIDEIAAQPGGLDTLSQTFSTCAEFFVNTFMLQIAVLSEGNDTRLRQIKIYGPRPNPIPCQPFHFSSAEFIRYSIVR